MRKKFVFLVAVFLAGLVASFLPALTTDNNVRALGGTYTFAPGGAAITEDWSGGRTVFQTSLTLPDENYSSNNNLGSTDGVSHCREEITITSVSGDTAAAELRAFVTGAGGFGGCSQLASGFPQTISVSNAGEYSGPGGGDAGGGESGTGDGEVAPPECNNSAGVLAWIGCAVVELLLNAISGITSIMNALLQTRPLSASSADGIFVVWSNIRNISLVFLVIAVLIAIFGQALSLRIDAYTIKKMLPRIFIAAIAIVLSFYIAAFLIDIFNVLGFGIRSIMYQSVQGLDVVLGDSADVTISLAVAGGIAALVLNPPALATIMLILIPVALAFLTALIVIILRQVIIIALVIVSPLAFVAWILPNTEQYFKRWNSLFMTMLFMYPIIMLVLGSGMVFATILTNGGGLSASATVNESNFLNVILALLALGGSVALVPLTLRTASGILGRVAGMVNNPNRGPIDRFRNNMRGARDSNAKKRAQDRLAALQTGKTASGKDLSKLRRGYYRSRTGTGMLSTGRKPWRDEGYAEETRLEKERGAVPQAQRIQSLRQEAINRDAKTAIDSFRTENTDGATLLDIAKNTSGTESEGRQLAAFERLLETRQRNKYADVLSSVNPDMAAEMVNRNYGTVNELSPELTGYAQRDSSGNYLGTTYKAFRGKGAQDIGKVNEDSIYETISLGSSEDKSAIVEGYVQAMYNGNPRNRNVNVKLAEAARRGDFNGIMDPELVEAAKKLDSPIPPPRPMGPSPGTINPGGGPGGGVPGGGPGGGSPGGGISPGGLGGSPVNPSGSSGGGGTNSGTLPPVDFEQRVDRLLSVNPSIPRNAISERTITSLELQNNLEPPQPKGMTFEERKARVIETGRSRGAPINLEGEITPQTIGNFEGMYGITYEPGAGEPIVQGYTKPVGQIGRPSTSGPSYSPEGPSGGSGPTILRPAPNPIGTVFEEGGQRSVELQTPGNSGAPARVNLQSTSQGAQYFVRPEAGGQPETEVAVVQDSDINWRQGTANVGGQTARIVQTESGQPVLRFSDDGSLPDKPFAVSRTVQTASGESQQVITEVNQFAQPEQLVYRSPDGNQKITPTGNVRQRGGQELIEVVTDDGKIQAVPPASVYKNENATAPISMDEIRQITTVQAGQTNAAASVQTPQVQESYVVKTPGPQPKTQTVRPTGGTRTVGDKEFIEVVNEAGETQAISPDFLFESGDSATPITSEQVQAIKTYRGNPSTTVTSTAPDTPERASNSTPTSASQPQIATEAQTTPSETTGSTPTAKNREPGVVEIPTGTINSTGTSPEAATPETQQTSSPSRRPRQQVSSEAVQLDQGRLSGVERSSTSAETDSQSQSPSTQKGSTETESARPTGFASRLRKRFNRGETANQPTEIGDRLDSYTANPTERPNPTRQEPGDVISPQSDDVTADDNNTEEDN